MYVLKLLARQTVAELCATCVKYINKCKRKQYIVTTVLNSIVLTIVAIFTLVIDDEH